jgi:hypothetical protein
VRVAAGSGALSDRPLVMAKASDVTVGSPSFTIRSASAAIVDVADGAIRITADVQVNGGSFCSFFVVRSPAVDKNAAVYLHDLAYTAGVPFSIALQLDVEGGTITATQDGSTVPVTVHDGGLVTGDTVVFPYMPYQFGFEGCTLNAQEWSVDDLRLEVR